MGTFKGITAFYKASQPGDAGVQFLLQGAAVDFAGLTRCGCCRC